MNRKQAHVTLDPIAFARSFSPASCRGFLDIQYPGIAYACGLSALLAIAFLVMFYRLGEHGIINGNESLYIESAREMLLSGNLAIPTLNGLPYLEKPPLFVWLLAAAIHLFGLSEFSARLVTALATLALLISISRFSKFQGMTATGLGAGCYLISSVGMGLMARVAMPDMFLTALFTIACLNFFRRCRRKTAKTQECAPRCWGRRA